MRYLLLTVLTGCAVYLLLTVLMGCAVSTPITHINNPEVAEMCAESGMYLYVHEGEPKVFDVTVMDWPQATAYCSERAGYTATACIINGTDIYVNSGVHCPVSMAHELTHGFGIHHHDY